MEEIPFSEEGRKKRRGFVGRRGRSVFQLFPLTLPLLGGCFPGGGRIGARFSVKNLPENLRRGLRRRDWLANPHLVLLGQPGNRGPLRIQAATNEFRACVFRSKKNNSIYPPREYTLRDRLSAEGFVFELDECMPTRGRAPSSRTTGKILFISAKTRKSPANTVGERFFTCHPPLNRKCRVRTSKLSVTPEDVPTNQTFTFSSGINLSGLP